LLLASCCLGGMACLRADLLQTNYGLRSAPFAQRNYLGAARNQEAGASGKKIRRSNARPGASPSRWGKIIMEGCWIFGNYKEWLINRYVRLNPWKSLPNLVRGRFYARAADADRRLGVRRKSGAPMRLRTRLMYAGLTRNWPAMSFVGRPAWIWKTICFSRSPWGSHPFSVFTQPRFVSVIGINF
jgi:hypothetical protein